MLVLYASQVKPLDQESPRTEERYVKNNKLSGDSLSTHSSMDEYYLLPEHRKGDQDTKSFEYHEMTDFHSAESTPASQRKVDLVTSTTEVVVPGAFFVNPMNGYDVERLSDLEGDADVWSKSSSNKNNSNNYGMYMHDCV